MARLFLAIASYAALTAPLLAEGSIEHLPDTLSELCASGRHFVFKGYTPSTWESEWLQNGQLWATSICKHMVEAKDRSIHWLEAIASWKDGPNFKALDQFSPDVFSRFVYEDVCASQAPQKDGVRGNLPSKIITYFEPVVGLLRHPQGGIKECLWEGAKFLAVDSREHLMVLGMRPRDFKALYPGKAYFFDLGTGVSYNSSLDWFVNEYENVGVEFQQIYVWEIKTVDMAAYWGDSMDRRIASKVHLFNMPVLNDTLAVGQIFQILLDIYKPGDFVSIKLDIDHVVLEGALIQTLRANRRIRHMISEIWFEQHFDAEPMRKFFGQLEFPYHKALETFHELRSMGVKLHIWP